MDSGKHADVGTGRIARDSCDRDCGSHMGCGSHLQGWDTHDRQAAEFEGADEVGQGLDVEEDAETPRR